MVNILRNDFREIVTSQKVDLYFKKPESLLTYSTAMELILRVKKLCKVDLLDATSKQRTFIMFIDYYSSYGQFLLQKETHRA